MLNKSVNFLNSLCFFIFCGGTWAFTIYETPQKIQADGFPSEVHHVTTTDGYILEMHRIPYGRSGSNGDIRPVVFLMHGLTGASNAYIALGPEYSIAYNLADAGFDVWMGNARGNKNSRNHISLNPDNFFQKFTFFDFTFEEIAIHDLPAMIDYVLEFTNQETLHYIGHSQGGTVFLILTSMRTEYNHKIQSAHLLAGVGYQEYFPDEELKETAEDVDSIYAAARLLGLVELYPPGSTDMVNFPRDNNGSNVTYKTSDYCTGDVEQRHMCELFGVNKILRDDVYDDDVGGASLKQLAHYGQNIRDKLFRRYHHGTLSNNALYGSADPPLYDLSLITCPVTMHYTVSDNLLDERDVLAMAEDMPNTVVRKVARETFEHADFVIAADVKELVTDFIIASLTGADDVQYPSYTTNFDVIVVDHEPVYDSSTETVTSEPSQESVTSEPSLEAIPEIPESDAASGLSSIIAFYLIALSCFIAML